MHGYELIQQIADKTGGVWTPSPGSIYPALQQLEDEGLLAFERVEGARPRPSPTRAGPTSRSTGPSSARRGTTSPAASAARPASSGT